MNALDQNFGRMVALINSTKHEGEREAARAYAEMMATAAGMTLEQALFHHLSNPPTASVQDPSTAEHELGQIGQILVENPSRSERDIARSCGCSPTTVGKVRRELGLSKSERSVSRSGQRYRIKVRKQRGAAPHEGGMAKVAGDSHEAGAAGP